MSTQHALAGGKRGANALKKWMSHAHLVQIPIHDAVQGKEVTYFALHIHEVLNFKVPAPVQKTASPDDRYGVRVNLTFYGAKALSFFGNTYEGPMIFFDEPRPDTVEINEYLYFCSPISDKDCYGVIELQAIHENSKTGHKTAYAGGWSTIKLFSNLSDLVDVDEEDNLDEEVDELSLYQGSPRGLVSMSPEVIRKKSGWKQFRGRQLTYTLRTFNRLEKVSHLFKMHNIIGSMERVGGVESVEGPDGRDGPYLMNENDASAPANPELAIVMELEVKDIVVKIPKIVDQGIENALKKVKSRGKDGNRVERSLRIGLHNGHTLVEPQSSRGRRGRGDWKDGWSQVELSKSRKSPEGIYRADGVIIPHYCKDSSMALVVELVYSIGGGHEAVVATSMLVPFDGSRYLDGISTTTSRKKNGALIYSPMVRGSVISPNGFTGGVSASRAGPDGGTSLPLLTIGMVVDEPDDVLEEQRRKAKEKSKLRKEHESRLEEDESEVARRKKLESVEKKRKGSAKDGKGARAQKKKKKYSSDSDEENDSIFKKGKRGQKRSSRYGGSDAEKEDRTLQSKSNVLGGEAVVSGLPRGSNDVLMRSLLAQSLKQPLRKPGMNGVGEVTAATGAYYPGAAAVIGGQTPLATELTRASKTFLSRNGYTDVLSDSVSSAAAVRRVPLPSRRKIDLDVELSDPLAGHEVTFQFAAFRSVEGLNISQPRSVYFTFQFFNNLPTRTERMVLAANGDKFLNRRASGSMSLPQILLREDRHGRNVPSLAIKYNVDTSTIPGETRDFAEYLAMKTLFIEVWDGESLHQVGTIAVEMQQLLRQGEPVVKTALEYDVISSNIEGDSTSALPIIQARSVPAGRVAGRVQLLISNYGVPGAGPFTEVGASNAAMKGNAAPGRQFLSKSQGDRDWRVGARTGNDTVGNSAGSARHRARAVPLASTNPELKSILTSRVGRSLDVGSGERTTSVARRKKSKWGDDRTDVRALSDPFSLSPSELDGLFGHCSSSESPGKINWKVFVEDILGAKVAKAKKPISPREERATDKLEKRLRKILDKAIASGLDFNDMFDEFDENKDGKISSDEFAKALKKLGFHAENDEMNILMLRFDVNEDNTITISEFIDFAKDAKGSLANKKLVAVEKRLKKIIDKAEDKGMSVRDIFKHFDKNDDGKITKNEWTDALGELGIDVTDAEADLVLNHLDSNHNGKLSLKEFARFVTGKDEKESSGADGSNPKIRQLEKRLVAIFKKAEKKGMDVKDVFSHFDKDGRGEVDDRDFEDALEELGFRASRWELDTLVKKFDSNGDGYVSIAEFTDFAMNAVDGKVSLSKSKNGRAPARLKNTLVKCKDCHAKAISDGRDINAMFQAFDRGTGSVTRTEFRYVLMEMGLSLQDEQLAGEDDVRASTMRRQIDRLEKWRKRNGGDSKRNSRASEVVGKEHANKSLFARHSEDLELVRRFRDSRKKALVGRLLRSNISNEVTIHPSFGRTLFFEFPLRNPYSHEERFVIECPDPELRVVLDVNAWRHYRRVLQPAIGTLGDQIEVEMIDSELQLTLGPQETVHIPFMFISFASGAVAQSRPRKARSHRIKDQAGGKSGEGKRGEGKSGDDEDDFGSKQDDDFDGAHGAAGGPGTTIRRRTVPISFKSAHHGHIVSLLQVNIRPRPFCVDRTFRFHQAQNEFLKRCIAIHPRNFNPYSAAPALMPNMNDIADSTVENPVGPGRSSTMPAKFIHCPSSDVVVEWRDQADPSKPQEVFIRYRCGEFPSVGQFFIIVYADQYHAVIDEIWHVTVQSMMRVDVHGLVGQGTPVELMVKGDNYSRRVRCFSTHPGEVKFTPNVPFQLVPGAYNKVELMNRPLRVGNKKVLVHMVDVDTHELVCAWLATATSTAPIVTKTYDVSIPVGRSAHKKIAYINQWDRNRTFSLRTSHPNIMKCKEPQLSVRKFGKAFIRLWFAPISVPGIREFFVFVNDESDQNEECLLIKVQFS
eukprot:g7574.t1